MSAQVDQPDQRGRFPLSKSVRFEVFKRDGFQCRYCGSKPPAVVLHVDHVMPVSAGGSNDIENLVTACNHCNLGKGARLLSSVPQSLDDRAAEVAEREAQVQEYRSALEDGFKRYLAVMAQARSRLENGIDRVAQVFEQFWRSENPGFGLTLSGSSRQSVQRFLEQLDLYEVLEAAELACSNPYVDPDAKFRYFCGVCWRRVRLQEAGRA